MRLIDIDDDRNCYIGNDGEYERYNIDPDVLDEAVEIIHCKDCKHYYFADNRVEAEQCYVCGYWDFDSPSPNGFCSFAERREDG